MSDTPGFTLGKIRNIQQSVQYRDVIKQASDILVYIDGQNYLTNVYLDSPDGHLGQIVPFNDYVTSWQSSYSIDAMIPTGSLTLTVPAQDEHLFRMPGGKNLLATMAEIRVFAKGYYLSPRGNTVYRQIFRGFIGTINYSMTGKLTTIALGCSGSLGLLERMQVDMSPGSLSSPPLESMGLTSTSWNLDPYQSIAWVFLYGSMIDGFEVSSLDQAVMTPKNPYYKAMDDTYGAKWRALLYDLARDTHIFPVPNVDDVISSIQNAIKPDANYDQTAKQALGAAKDFHGKKSEVKQTLDNQDLYKHLREYLPDFGLSAIQLLNGRLTSRLERLRFLVNLIGFEGYQDVDGAIIIKPPLYNLDVMNIDQGGSDSPAAALESSLLYSITPSTNPFVAQLSEILQESENEDESKVRLTRVTARGNWSIGFQYNGSKELLVVAEDVDLPKLAQFGLRTEPPREAHWFTKQDSAAIYAFAASELARMNRGFRSYSLVLPMRPELRLGFPMYLPHRDMYGYIHSITMDWTRGSAATTTVTLDSLRPRFMLPESENVNDESGQPKKTQFFTPAPDLMLQWTKAAAPTEPTDDERLAKTISVPVANPILGPQQKMIQAREQGVSFGVNSDDNDHCWRIQPDDGKTDIQVQTGDGKTTGVTNLFNGATKRPVDKNYYAMLRTARPYTDGKGYEVVGPFPWGRWTSLTDALALFTVSGTLGGQKSASAPLNEVLKPVDPSLHPVQNLDAFLFTGSYNPESDAASTFINAMDVQVTMLNQYKMFELTYDNPASASPIFNGDSLPASGSTPIEDDPEEIAKVRAHTMLTGTAQKKTTVQSILDGIKKKISNIGK